ncbi:hypothetical protein [Desulfofustis glycolicus]|nr:hypothetical protein [Desulfofustis glycolicus]
MTLTSCVVTNYLQLPGMAGPTATTMAHDDTGNATRDQVVGKLEQLFDEVLGHDGYGRIEVDMKILRKGQKEVVLRCGKEYRYVLDFACRRQRR